MEAKNIIEVESLVIESNDLLTGKFFDLNRRLEKFLSVLGESEDVLDVLADALVDFDEEAELQKAFSFDRKTGAVKVTLPSDEKKRLALFLTIFDNIVNGKLNANQFLETFFQDSKSTPIQNFLDKIVRPFRDILCKLFDIAPNVSILDVKKHEQELNLAKQKEEEEVEAEQEENEQEALPHLGELLQEIRKSCQQILALISFEKKRGDVLDDVEFVTNSILRACDKEDLMLVNGLVIGLGYVAKKFKNARHIIEDMKNLIYDYYDFLANPEGETEELAPETDEDFDGGIDG